jgi:hypothetical protein
MISAFAASPSHVSGPDEHRLIKRCRVMADRIFDPAFVDTALRGAA